MPALRDGRGRWQPSSELRWAWRGVYARRWRAIFIILLLATALAANVTVFSVSDSLLFLRFPYPQAERIVRIQTLRGTGRIDPPASAALLREWGAQTDLLSAVGSYRTGTVFLTDIGSAELVSTVDVTAGLLDVLGVTPRWGRGFVDRDASETGAIPILVSESFATRRFRRPALALGQRLQSTAGPLYVIGIMPGDFMFPSSTYQIWRLTDPADPPSRGFASARVLVRLRPNQSFDALAAAIEQRTSVVGRAAGLSAYGVEARPFATPAGNSVAGRRRQALTLVLVGAALSLLLAGCASVVNLELAGAIRRGRTYAIQLALGAPRAALGRMAALEGALLVAAALVVATGLAWISLGLVGRLLPNALLSTTANPIDLDTRALVYMGGVAAIAWVVAALPSIVKVTRSTLVTVLKTEERTASSGSGSLIRRGLTTAQVAVAVVLVIGGLLYTRSYLGLLHLDKGFDSANLAELVVVLPRQAYPSAFHIHQLETELEARLMVIPGVVSTTRAPAPPGIGNARTAIGTLEIDGGEPAGDEVVLGSIDVDERYFAVVGLRRLSGRFFAANEPHTSVIVPDTFARRFWPGADPVGHAFRLGANQPWNTVVGVVGSVRVAADRAPDPTDLSFVLYRPEQRPLPSGEPDSPTVAPSNSWDVRWMTVRMDSTAPTAAVLAVAQAIDRRAQISVNLVDDYYARQHGNTQLASYVVGAFSVLAFLVAMAGVYGVMLFLFTSRSREIGIRMALGADDRNIRRLVLASSARLVAIGAVVGAISALVASRWIESQLFGVTATDPVTYLLVCGVVTTTALAATWHPARQAARVDPAVTLRAE